MIALEYDNSLLKRDLWWAWVAGKLTREETERVKSWSNDLLYYHRGLLKRDPKRMTRENELKDLV